MVTEKQVEQSGLKDAAHQDREFSLEIFQPPSLVPEQEEALAATEEQAEGIALHALLERLSYSRVWPYVLPEPEVIAAWLPCSSAIAHRIRKQAENILSNPVLDRFFNSAHHISAHNEMEVWFERQLLRLDRVVVFQDEVWVLDYKRQLLPDQRSGYFIQLSQYVAALQAMFNAKTVHGALILSDGGLVELL